MVNFFFFKCIKRLLFYICLIENLLVEQESENRKMQFDNCVNIEKIINLETNL